MALDPYPRPDTAPARFDDPPPRARRAAVPVGIAVGSSAAVWLVAPEVVRATVSGPGPLLRVAAVVAALVAWSAVVRRLVPVPVVARTLAVVPALAVTAWAVLPYLGDDVVDEDFPVAAAQPVDVVTDDDAGTDAQAAPDDVAAPAATAPATTPTTSAVPAGPVATTSGGFQGLTGHRGEGTATVYELGDGSRVLRLEDLHVSNGPGLELHLVPGADRRGPEGGVSLGLLEGNRGNQNYELPADLDLSAEWTVLVWCAPFTVEVANATLAPVA